MKTEVTISTYGTTYKSSGPSHGIQGMITGEYTLEELKKWAPKWQKIDEEQGTTTYLGFPIGSSGMDSKQVSLKSFIESGCVPPFGNVLTN